jgi:serine/threonine protein phosphatase PrpC
LSILSKKSPAQQPKHPTRKPFFSAGSAPLREESQDPRLKLDRDFAGRQIVGTRDEQQDSYAFSIVEGDENGAEKLLVIVADGMGGYVGGREASLAAVSGFVDAFFEAIDAKEDASASTAGGTPDAASHTLEDVSHHLPEETKPQDASSTEHCPPHNAPNAGSPEFVPPCPEGASFPSPGQASAPPWVEKENTPCPVGATSPLKTALAAANLAVDRMIAADPDTLGEAGTTLVAALIERDAVRWISVGDSPLLLWRKGKLTRLNADHSMRAVFAAKVAARQMRAADVATHPERNALLSVLTGLEIPKTDAPPDPTPLLPGDIVIAASDGLLTLTAAEISKALKKLHSAPALTIVRTLLEMVEKKGILRQDNTTVGIVRL